MKVTNTEFITGAVSMKQYPKESCPEFAFVGRSNVGKSSLIRSLLNRKKLVRISSTPGKTREINFFRINEKLIFSDLPGYGFARITPNIQKQWKKMIEEYEKVEFFYKKAKEVFTKMQRMGDTINLVAGEVDKVNVKGMPTELQIPSIMSRVYGIFRGVISPRYVMTELLIQDARFRKGEMLRQIATDPDAARIFTDVIFEKGIRNSKI